MVADLVGECVQCGAKGGDLVSEAGDGAAVGGALAVCLDHGTNGGVAVEGAAAESGAGGDGGSLTVVAGRDATAGALRSDYGTQEGWTVVDLAPAAGVEVIVSW